MNQLKSIILTLTLLLPLSFILAQESVATSGGTAVSGSGSVSYTVGQMSYTTNSSVSGSVSQGIQNAYDISVVTELPEGKGIALTCTAYPNPVKDFLILDILGTDISSLSFYLTDSQGGTIETNNIIEEKTSISLLTAASGTYFLKVVSTKNSQQKIIKTFKIIKIK